MLGFQSFGTARRTLAGVEAMAMLAKGQVRAVPANDMPAQRAFVRPGLRPRRLSEGERARASPATSQRTLFGRVDAFWTCYKPLRGCSNAFPGQVSSTRMPDGAGFHSAFNSRGPSYEATTSKVVRSVPLLRGNRRAPAWVALLDRSS